MRPTPNEVIDGVARILGDTIGPQLTDAHARNQLQQIIGVLGALDLAEGAFTLYARHAELCRLLEAVRQWVDGSATRRRDFRPIPPLSDATPTSFADINDRHEDARAVLATFVDDLARWRRDHDRSDSDELFERLGRYLAGRRAR